MLQFNKKNLNSHAIDRFPKFPHNNLHCNPYYKIFSCTILNFFRIECSQWIEIFVKSNSTVNEFLRWLSILPRTFFLKKIHLLQEITKRIWRVFCIFNTDFQKGPHRNYFVYFLALELWILIGRLWLCAFDLTLKSMQNFALKSTKSQSKRCVEGLKSSNHIR